MDGTAFGPETAFRSTIIGGDGSYLGTATFSAFAETGDTIPVAELAAALRAVFQQHGMDLQQFTGPVTTLLDWPEGG